MILTEEYARIIDHLPSSFQDAGGVLYSAVLTVVSCVEAHDIRDFEIDSEVNWYDPPTNKIYNIIKASDPNELTFSEVLRELSILHHSPTDSVHHSRAAVAIDEADMLKKKLYTEYYNANTSISVKNEGLPSPSGLLGFVKNAYLRRLCSLLLRPEEQNNTVKGSEFENLKKFPMRPAQSTQRRKLRDTELLNFTSLSHSDMHRFRQLQICQDMIATRLPPLPNFTKKPILHDGEDRSILRRRYHRQFSSLALLGSLIQSNLMEPELLTSYDSWTDSLLLVMYWDCPARRIRNNREVYFREEIPGDPMPVPVVVPSPIATNDVRSPRSPKSKKIAAPVPEVIVSPPKVKEYGIESVTMTPAGRSLILIKKYLSSNTSWQSIYLPCGSILGLRPPSGTCLVHGELASSVFFYQGNDDFRVAVSLGESRLPTFRSKKDPSFVPRAVFVKCLLPSGIACLVSSSGTARITVQSAVSVPPTGSLGMADPSGREIRRYLLIGGRILRILEGGLFRKDVLYPNGDRQLFRAQSIVFGGARCAITAATLPTLFRATNAHSSYLMSLFADAPQSWDSILLSVEGKAIYLASSQDMSTGIESLPEQRHLHMPKTLIDAETLVNCKAFCDGRVITKYPVAYESEITRTQHCDGTVMTLIRRLPTDSSESKQKEFLPGSALIIEKAGYPSIEVDLETDLTADEHSRGSEVPIMRGGSRVRTRISFGDGSAVMVRYDTRVTSSYRGSIDVIRRDRATITASEDGKVDFKPNSAWDAQRNEGFLKDNSDPAAYPESLPHVPTFTSSTDTLPPFRQSTSASDAGILQSGDVFLAPTPSDTDSQYTFDLRLHTCLVVDPEHNTFASDLSNGEAMNPKVCLSGEVVGLKPTAVAADLLDPRVFVIRRDGTAVETLSVAAVRSLERGRAAIGRKISAPVSPQPSDLSACTQHTYMHALAQHSQSFECTFSPRPWLHQKTPSAASYLLIQAGGRDRRHSASAHGASHGAHSLTASHTLSVCVLSEELPLSQEGYGALAEAMEKWKRFKQAREQVLADYRSAGEVVPRGGDDEARVQARLKAAYKLKKGRKKAMGGPKHLGEGSVSTNPLEGVTEEVDATDPEDSEKEEEEDDVSVAFSSDSEESEEEDLEMREVTAAFQQYAVPMTHAEPPAITSLQARPDVPAISIVTARPQTDDPAINPTASDELLAADLPAYLPTELLQAALTQVCNYLVSSQEIKEAQKRLCLRESDPVYFSDFLRIYLVVCGKELDERGVVEDDRSVAEASLGEGWDSRAQGAGIFAARAIK